MMNYFMGYLQGVLMRNNLPVQFKVGLMRYMISVLLSYVCSKEKVGQEENKTILYSL